MLHLVAVDVGAAGPAAPARHRGRRSASSPATWGCRPRALHRLGGRGPGRDEHRVDQAARPARRPRRAAPGRPGHDHRPARAARPRRRPGRRSTTRPRPTPSRRWSPTPRSRSSRTSRPSAPPTSSRRCRPTTRPTSSPTSRTRPGPRSSRSWSATRPTSSGELLRYPEDTAGGIMTTEFVAVPADLTAGRDHRPAARARARRRDDLLRLRGRRRGAAGGRAVAARPDRRAAGQPGRRGHDPGAGGRRTCWPTRTRSPRSSPATTCWPCPCVDAAGRLVGIVTVDDAMDTILPAGWRRRLPRPVGRG